MRTALDNFSPYYLESLRPYMYTSTDSTEYLNWVDSDTASFRSDMKDRMEKFLDEECRLFDCDDPGILELEEALESLDLKVIHYAAFSFSIMMHLIILIFTAFPTRSLHIAQNAPLFIWSPVSKWNDSSSYTWTRHIRLKPGGGEVSYSIPSSFQITISYLSCSHG